MARRAPARSPRAAAHKRSPRRRGRAHRRSVRWSASLRHGSQPRPPRNPAGSAPSPAPRCAAAARRPAAAGEAAAAVATETAARRRSSAPARAPTGAAVRNEHRAAAAIDVAPARCVAHIADQKSENEDDRQEEQKRKERIENTRGIVVTYGGLRLPIGSVAAEHADNALDAALDAAGEIAGLEPRDDGARDDDRGKRVGQRTLEPIAHLDAYFVLGRGDQKKNAVVLLRLAELPETEQLISVSLDIAALQRLDRGDDQLNAGFVFEAFEHLLEIVAGARLDDAGLVDDAAGERRKIKRQGGEHQAENEPGGRARRDRRAHQRTRPSAGRARLSGTTAEFHQNFTGGGLSEPSVAVNSAIGLLPEKKNFAHSKVGKVRSAVL